jgi:phage baseplate assembly protein W
MSSITFPIVVNGATQTTNDLQTDIRQSVLSSLLNERQSTAFQRGFGSRIHFMLFEPNAEIQRSLIETFVREALSTETRIIIKKVSVISQQETITILVDYLVTGTRQIQNIILTI